MTGFLRLMRAEWTKLRSVRSTVVCLVFAVGLVALTAAIGGSGSTTDANSSGPPHADSVQFAFQSLDGDGSITARLVSQQETGPDAKAGLLLRTAVEQNSPYAAIMVTAGYGVRWQGNFAPDVAGTVGKAPRWLRLTRSGGTVTGFESPDGKAWAQVGSVTLPDAPRAVAVGMFVASPPTGLKNVRRGPGATESGPDWTVSTAVFDSVAVVTATGAPVDGAWQNIDTSGPLPELPDTEITGSFTRDGDRFTLTGAGNLGLLPYGYGADSDVVRDSFSGIYLSAIAIAVLSVLFITSEFSRGVIRITFAINPRRGRVLAAKAAVLGLVAFVTGVFSAVVAFLISQPLLRDNGFRPPAYPDYSLTDWVVVRAVLGTGLILALFALFALAMGTLLRRGAGAITLAIGVLVFPFIIGAFLSLEAESWLRRLTPMAGLAVQQTMRRLDDVITPGPGLAVLASYVVVALGLAYWQLRRRDP
ncbi:MAG TPA: ABC transporter permease subunit [Candidatus Limnocylindrales bacterium]|nr:ABC transporter permease subunit [Candidatus Limnocylindrales bacterium]